MRHRVFSRFIFLMVCIVLVSPSTAAEIRQVTNLYDAFGAPSAALVKDWGFAALVEYGGRRILFDTGNDEATFARNVSALGIDLTKLDAVVISHRHGDHTSGLAFLLSRNPHVTIYVPEEGAFFKSALPRDFLQRQPDLPKDLQYFGGAEPARWITGSPWPKANFKIVSATTEIFPGFYLLSAQSQRAGTRDMNELSLAIRTPRGLAVIVGCSHPGIEEILSQAATLDSRLYTALGGFHLVRTPESEVRRVARVLHDELKLERVAPAHCTSERGFAVFREIFGKSFDLAGLGSVVSLP